MAIATEYNPDNKQVREAAEKEFRGRMEKHQRNMKYYRGDMKKPLKVETVDDNVIVNLCGQAVDRTVSFVVAGQFPAPQLDGERNRSSDEQFLDDAWREFTGDPATWLKLAAVAGAVDGHVFIKFVPTATLGQYRLVLLDSSQIIKFTAEDDVDRVLWYEQRWTTGKNKYRQDIVRDGEQWLYIDYVMKGSKWEEFQRVEWRYPLAPVVEWQHLPVANQPYGMTELKSAPLNDAVNAVLSDVRRILRFHASPRTIGTGFEASAVQAAGIDNFWTIPNESANVFNLEMQSDLVSSMTMARYLRQQFFAESRVFVEDMEDTAPKTATEVRRQYADMLAKIGTIRSQYSAGLEEIERRFLMLAGRRYERVINREWGEPLPMDRQLLIQEVQFMLSNGLISKQTAAEKLGLDYTIETERMSSEIEFDTERFMRSGDNAGRVLAMATR